MSSIIKQVTSLFPNLPPGLLLFLAIVAGFIALSVALVILRLLWAIISAPFRLRRRRRGRYMDPNWERQVRLNELRQRHRWEDDE